MKDMHIKIRWKQGFDVWHFVDPTGSFEDAVPGVMATVPPPVEGVSGLVRQYRPGEIIEVWDFDKQPRKELKNEEGEMIRDAVEGEHYEVVFPNQ